MSSVHNNVAYTSFVLDSPTVVGCVRDFMLFSGLGESYLFCQVKNSIPKACFSPSVPAAIRRLWGTHFNNLSLLLTLLFITQ